VGKPERKTLFGRHRHRCEDNIEIYIEETGWEALTGLFWLKRRSDGVL
jgi:23S rRNA maturation mini-RNase III